MEEMDLYDNIDDKKEKQSIKMKNKSQKNDRSQDLSHSTNCTFGGIPSFQS